MTEFDIRRQNGPLRVLRVIDKLGYGNYLHGPGRMWLNSLAAFDPSRCEMVPCVLRLDEGVRRQFTQGGIALRDLRKWRYDPSTIITLCHLIRRERIDLLHLHGYGAATFGRIAGLLMGVPAIIHQHDNYQDSYPWYVKVLDRWLASTTSHAVAVSKAVAEFCVTARQIPRERVEVIPNAVGLQWSVPVVSGQLRQLREELGIPDGCHVIGTIGRLSEEKDVPSLLAATARLREAGRHCHVILVGDGPDRTLIERCAVELGLADNVHFAGFQTDVRPYVSLIDVVVFSSRGEGSPLALLEAMAAARPVVATDVEGMRDLVRDGQNGLVVPVHDPQAMARAIERLFVEPNLAARLRAQAKLDTRAYEVPAYVERLQCLYERVAGYARHQVAGRNGRKVLGPGAARNKGWSHAR